MAAILEQFKQCPLTNRPRFRTHKLVCEILLKSIQAFTHKVTYTNGTFLFVIPKYNDFAGYVAMLCVLVHPMKQNFSDILKVLVCQRNIKIINLFINFDKKIC